MRSPAPRRHGHPQRSRCRPVASSAGSVRGRRIGPARMMCAIDQSGEACPFRAMSHGESGITAVGAARQMGLHRLGATLLDQIVGGLVSERRQRLAPKPAKGSPGRTCPVGDAVDDLDRVAQPRLGLMRSQPTALGDRIARKSGRQSQLGLDDCSRSARRSVAIIPSSVTTSSCTAGHRALRRAGRAHQKPLPCPRDRLQHGIGPKGCTQLLARQQ